VAAGLRVPGAVFAVEKVAVLLAIAVWFHYLLALPNGRLGGAGRRIAAGLGYACLAAAGLGLAVAGTSLHTGMAALIWVLATLLALPAVRLRYVRSAGHDKERMQWLGTGLVAAADIAFIAAVLHLLVGRRGWVRSRPERRWPCRCAWPWRNGGRSRHTAGGCWCVCYRWRVPARWSRRATW